MSSMSRGSLPDGSRLHAVAGALAPLWEVAAEGAEEAMALYVDVGDRATQAALDRVLEQVADSLRAVDAEAGDQVGTLELAARRLAGDVAEPAPTEPTPAELATPDHPAPADDGGPR